MPVNFSLKKTLAKTFNNANKKANNVYLKKLIISIYLYINSALCFANEYSIDYIIKLEQTFNKLNSEINILTQARPVTNTNIALFYIKKKSWNKIYYTLLTNSTDIESIYYKYILYGISLQGMNKNKEAIEYYNKVHYKSTYYATAQINMALLYKHNGLNNNSIDIINKILTNPDIVITKQIKNHIYLILGYLYNNEHKYIKSNEVFKKIELNSIYSSRAIIGLLLNAIELNDLKSLEKLSLTLIKNDKFDLPGDESYLIKAFSYSSQGEHNKSIAAYSDAINHYKKRIESIDNIIYQFKPLVINEIINKHIFVISDNKIDLLEYFPIEFFNHYAELIKMKRTVSDLMGKNNYMYYSTYELHSKYSEIINKLLIKKLSDRSKYLMDYLIQSRYGLAVSSDLLISEN